MLFWLNFTVNCSLNSLISRKRISRALMFRHQLNLNLNSINLIWFSLQLRFSLPEFTKKIFDLKQRQRRVNTSIHQQSKQLNENEKSDFAIFRSPLSTRNSRESRATLTWKANQDCEKKVKTVLTQLTIVTVRKFFRRSWRTFYSPRSHLRKL